MLSTAKILMSLLIKQEVLSGVDCRKQFQKFDFSKKECFLPVKSMPFGFAAEQHVVELKKKDILSLDSIKGFMKDRQLIIISIL